MLVFFNSLSLFLTVFCGLFFFLVFFLFFIWYFSLIWVDQLQVRSSFIFIWTQEEEEEEAAFQRKLSKFRYSIFIISSIKICALKKKYSSCLFLFFAPNHCFSFIHHFLLFNWLTVASSLTYHRFIFHSSFFLRGSFIPVIKSQLAFYLSLSNTWTQSLQLIFAVLHSFPCTSRSLQTD